MADLDIAAEKALFEVAMRDLTNVNPYPSQFECWQAARAAPTLPKVEAGPDDAVDAARYRYLRNTVTLDVAVWEALDGYGSDTESGYAVGMDRAIDAARLAARQDGEGV